MNAKPSWLQEKEIILPNGKAALWSYDSEGDILEVFFTDAPASGTVELADGIMLRFDRVQERPLSIAFVGATAFTQRQEFGLPLVALEGLNQLPEADRKLILQMLQTLPLNAILQLYSFKPKARARTIPVASLKQTLPLAA